MRCAFCAGFAVMLAGCMNDVSGPAQPVVGTIVAAGSPHNSLSFMVSVGVSNADSVAVRFRLDDVLLAGDSITPAVPVAEGMATVPVLGLLPERSYAVSAVAYGPSGIAVGTPVLISSGTLPSDLPRYAVSGSNPAPGYVVFAAGAYGLVIDNTGRVVWYRRFADGPGLNFMAQPNGRYAARPTTPERDDLEPWLEIDPAGNVTRTFGCAHGLQPRFHDLIAQQDGSYWLMCDETRTVDLSSFGGAANAAVMGTAVQHISASGALLFDWSAFDHFAITDLDSADRTGASVNWTHGNSLDLDTDGNPIVSRSEEHTSELQSLAY